MCNLIRLRAKRWEIQAYYEANERFRDEMEIGREELSKDYVSPGRDGWVIREEAGKRGIEMMQWGWPKPPSPKLVVNVRNYKSPFWRSALANPERRCLVPFSDFQEWTQHPDALTGKKSPHFFHIPSRPIGTLAGIWRPSEKGPIFAFLTTGYSESKDPEAEREAAANHIVGRIHPKAIPVILDGEEDFQKWLRAPVEEALTLATAFPSQLLSIDGEDPDFP